MKKNSIIIFSLVLITFLIQGNDVFAATSPNFIELKVGGEGTSPTSAVQLLLLFGIMGLAPSLFIMFTCFPYIMIVLGMTRQGLGTPTLPPNQVMVGLAFFLTVYIMYPVFEDVYQKAWVPLENGKIETSEAIEAAEKPLKKFILDNTDEKDLELILKVREDKKPANYDDVSIFAAVPSYTLTQIQEGLITGMYIVGMFVFMDIFIGTILMFMGMMMLPPQMVSLPFKILIFVYIGGFNRIVELILKSVNV